MSISSSADSLSSAPTKSGLKPRAKIPFGYVVIALVVAGIAVLIFATASGGRYELEVGQVASAPEKFAEKNVRVRGQIKEGSIVTTAEGGRPLTRFTLVDGDGHELKVMSRESPPDNFEGGKSCIVEGRFSGAGGEVESTRLTMKCPSKYEAESGRPATTDDLYHRYKSESPR